MCYIFNRGLDTKQMVLLTHGDSIDKVAEGFTSIAKSGDLIAGIVMLTHGDSIDKVAEGFTSIAKSGDLIAGIVMLTHGDSIDKVAEGFTSIAKSGDLIACTVMIRLCGHVCSQSKFPDKRVFWITESPISPDVEIGSYTFCPDQRDFWTIGARINESFLYWNSN